MWRVQCERALRCGYTNAGKVQQLSFCIIRWRGQWGSGQEVGGATTVCGGCETRSGEGGGGVGAGLDGAEITIKALGISTKPDESKACRRSPAKCQWDGRAAILRWGVREKRCPNGVAEQTRVWQCKPYL